ncbi:MAG: transposase [Okeania sp. SIO3B3]|nr:transposase [Okeania sp. SIO3B3]
MKFQDIAKKPIELLSMTGHTLEEFNSLLPWFEEALDEAEFTLEGKKREKKVAIYKNSPFPTTADRLFFILVYFKQYTKQTMLGLSFGISQSKANLWIHFLSPILQSALSKMETMPCREMSKLNLSEVDVFAHDGVERPIQRPKENEKQEFFYSGKQKCHTVKNNVLANSMCKIIYLTPTVEGKRHDKRLADHSEYNLPKGSILLQDTGFQGFNLQDISIVQPKKKPRGGKLTEEEKLTNREISKVRVRIEHIIRSVKIYGIVKDKFRNWLKGFKDQVMEIACGLHNFKLQFRPWKPIEFNA